MDCLNVLVTSLLLILFVASRTHKSALLNGMSTSLTEISFTASVNPTFVFSCLAEATFTCPAKVNSGLIMEKLATAGSSSWSRNSTVKTAKNFFINPPFIFIFNNSKLFYYQNKKFQNAFLK